MRAGALLLPLVVVVPWAGAARAEPPLPTAVVVVKRAGVTAYEEVAEEFAERCRVRARVVSFGDEGVSPERARLRESELVVTVGQDALDALVSPERRLIPTLAFHVPPGLPSPMMAPPPELLLRLLKTARPSVVKVAVVYGRRAAATVAAGRRSAESLDIALEAAEVQGGPDAVRALHHMIDAGGIDAIWLPGDTDVVTLQVFQYALRLQLERGLPLVAATREQVRSGAFLAVDFDPRAAGRAAAELANRMLQGRPAGDSELDLHGGARISISKKTARRLGIDTTTLERMGARVE